MSEELNIKQMVVNLIQHMPDDVTFEDIQYHLFVNQKLQKANLQIAAGETIPHKEVMEKIRNKWLV